MDEGRVKASWVKRRTRNIDRQLNHASATNLPANIRHNLERERAALQSTAEHTAIRKRRSKMISRYHMVRFFERQKATRLLKQLRRQLDATCGIEGKSKLLSDIRTAEVDIAYTTYHPYLEPYTSLYAMSAPQETTNMAKEIATSQGSNAVTIRKSLASARMYLDSPRPALWYTVKEAIVQGQWALEGLRDRAISPAIARSSARHIPTAGRCVEGGIESGKSSPDRGSKLEDFFE